MNPQVTAAVISGSVAFVVALAGIAGAIAAQAIATRRAFDNSLALFERQRSAQEQQQQEQSRREDAYRFADQRRSTYARFLDITAKLAQARQGSDDAHSNYQDAEYYEQHPDEYYSDDREPPGPDELRKMRNEASSESGDAEIAWVLARFAAASVADEVQLLASPQVRLAADDLWREASWLPSFRIHEGTELPQPAEPREGRSRRHFYQAARAAFVEAARHELGVIDA